MSESEIWKSIELPNIRKYKISNLGNVKDSFNRIVEPELKNNCYKVVLNDDNSTGKRKKRGYYIHELMNTFDNPKHELRNTDKLTSVKKEKNTSDKKERKIMRIGFGETIVYNSLIEACRINRISANSIKSCLKGTQSKLNGYEWKMV